MNKEETKRGFERLTLVMSIGVALFAVFSGLAVRATRDELLFVALAVFCAIWAIHLIIRYVVIPAIVYIVKGFKGNTKG